MDAADSPSTSSKVIVQCSDPYGLFDRILPELRARQKLGKLHWKSSTRPLRSIDTLNVSFVREDKDNNASNATRRHQIPGLRQTPFVKVLLVRCDDRETYKETTRKEVKQWLKSQGLSTDGKTSTKGQENHDAFEYIILHVILPNTPAASQPKSSKHLSIEANESTDSIESKSKWPGKTKSTIYDKLRADFSSSSKVPFERIAQVRILDAGARPISTLNPAENTELWQDFVEKLKTAILASFDIRVAQYEDDIRDRDSQRHLPGWNFCTFFILKEGLARGFENVGLLEDAMIVYDELDAGIDNVVQEQAKQTDIDSAGALLPFSNDLKPAIRSALDTLQEKPIDSNGTSAEPSLAKLIEFEREHFPFNITKLDYQHRILINQVSALDLRLYLFTRKLQLLFRNAKGGVAIANGRTNADQSKPIVDVGSIAEITEKTLQFIAFGARALHQDLYAAWGGQEGLSEDELGTQEYVIGNLVASWKFSALMQAIHDCHLMDLLPGDISALSDESLLANSRKSNGRINQNTPQRNGLDRHSSAIFSNEQLVMPNDLERQQSSEVSLQQSNLISSNSSRPDARERLALWTAELFLRLRSVVRDANPAVAILQNSEQGFVDNIPNGHRRPSVENDHLAAGLQSSGLKLVSTSSEICVKFFKMFTIYAYQYYMIAKQIQASRQMLLSLAKIAYSEGSSEYAANLLREISGISILQVRTITDFSILALYAKIVEDLERPNEYAKSLLSIFMACSSTVGELAIKNAGVDLQQSLNDFIDTSTKVEPCEVPLTQMFVIQDVGKSIQHVPSKDGFSLALSLSSQIPVSILLKSEITLTMVAAQRSDPETITLQTTPDVNISSTPCNVVLESNVTTFGWYNLDSLVITIGNMKFKHLFQDQSLETNVRRNPQPGSWPIMLYPRAGALSVKIYPAPDIDLTKTRRVRVGVDTGDNDIQTASVRMKPSTAGVRLKTLEAELLDSDTVQDFGPVQTEKGTALRMQHLSQEHAIVFDIPYTSENALLNNLDIKFEISYVTEQGEFQSFLTESTNATLTIAVNVQDIFQVDCLYSRFTAGPATNIPVQVMKWQIEDTDLFEAESCLQNQRPIQTFPKLHTSWVARITRKNGQAKTNQSNKMPLTVHYQCLDDMILSVVEEQFQTDLEAGPCAHASALLMKHLSSHIPKLWNEPELEMTALLQEIRLWSFEEMDWVEVLRALSKQERAEAEVWLREWHQKHEFMDLSSAQAFTRILRLVVDVPQPVLVVATQLCVQPTSPGTLVVGQPVKAELILSFSAQSTDEVLLVDYEVNGQIETWLIGGRKRGTVEVLGDSFRILILLIAQKSGHHILPSIDIRARRIIETDGLTPLVFEVEHKSQAESVLVIPAVQTTTVTLGTSPASGGYSVAESHRIQYLST